jgi:hypothetical protein
MVMESSWLNDEHDHAASALFRMYRKVADAGGRVVRIEQVWERAES